MKLSHSAVLVSTALLSACATVPTREVQTSRSSLRILSDAEVAAHAAATAAEQRADALRRPRNVTLGEQPGSVWQDPVFQNEFNQSYLAESEVEPTVTEPERDTLQEVLELMSAEQTEAAIHRLERSAGPNASAVFDFTLANIHFQADRLDLAAGAYVNAVAKYPKFRRAWKNLGLIYTRVGNPSAAIAAFTRVIELGGGDATTFGFLGMAYSALGDSVAAESSFRMASLLDPATLEWKLGMAGAFFKQERFGDAVALCQGLLAEDPDHVDIWNLQGKAYLGMGQPLRAAENFEMVDRLGAATAETLNMLGDIYVNEKLFDLAVTYYERAMDTAPDDGPARAVTAAKVLNANGAMAETKALVTGIESRFGDFLAQKPNRDMHKALLNLRAVVAASEGAGAEEAAVLERIVELDPLDGQALIQLGEYKRRQRDLEKAVFYFERAANLETFEADAKVHHAQLLVGEGRYAEALPLLRRAQDLQFRQNIQDYLEQVERVAGR